MVGVVGEDERRGNDGGEDLGVGATAQEMM